MTIPVTANSTVARVEQKEDSFPGKKQGVNSTNTLSLTSALSPVQPMEKPKISDLQAEILKIGESVRNLSKLEISDLPDEILKIEGKIRNLLTEENLPDVSPLIDPYLPSLLKSKDLVMRKIAEDTGLPLKVVELREKLHSVLKEENPSLKRSKAFIYIRPTRTLKRIINGEEIPRRKFRESQALCSIETRYPEKERIFVLLPNLRKLSWNSGLLEGLRCDDLEVDVSWGNRKIKTVHLRSSSTSEYTISLPYGAVPRQKKENPFRFKDRDMYLIVVSLKVREEYVLDFVDEQEHGTF